MAQTTPATTTTIASTLTTMQARTQQGDTLDLLCWRVYGDQMLASNVVERALLLNQGLADLADLGVVLPAGQLITLPVLSTQNLKEVVQLWT